MSQLSGQTAIDLARGRSDIEFFATRWLGINGNPGQIRWWKACAERAEDGYRPRYLTTAVSAGNRAGKTLAMAVVCLHHAIYKLGIRPPTPGSREDAQRWISDPYEWYHVGIQQETAELVHREISMILQGVHPAQKGQGCPLTKELGKIADFEKRYRGEYLWVKFSPILGGASIHFRTTQDKAKALLGKDMNGISFDEAAFEPHLVTIYQEVLNLRRLSTGGPLHFIGTPTEGFNDYSDLWEMGNPENPNRDPQFISFRMSTRDNIGFGLKQQDFDAVVRQQAEYLIPQNVDGYFIESRKAFFSSLGVEACFDSSIEFEEAPKSAHRYVQGCDPGISSDATWAITLDITNRKMMRGVRARKRGGKQTITAVVNMVREGHLLYSSGAQCTTIVDSTGMGGKLFREEFSIIKPLRDFDFGGTKSKKLELLNDLKAIVDRGNLKFPRGGVWEDLRRQMLAYKLEDKRIEQDAVMALAIAVRYAIRNPEKAVANMAFSYFGAAE